MLNYEYELYENGDVELRICHFDDTIRYWIKGSVGYIEFTEDNFKALLQLLVEYNKEYKKGIWSRLRSIYGR